MANDVSVAIELMVNILNKLPEDKVTIRFNAISFGKEIKGYPYKSKTQVLTKSEIQNFSQDLMNIYKNWAVYGDKNWKVKEIPAMRFTIRFTRTEVDSISTYLDVE